MGYTVAKYIRLSLEDSKSDSLSIENQRFLLDGFIEDMDEDDIAVLEFVDNGYSGTNFERPAVQELLELVRTGGIDCIVVKDFSRFGRNMVEAGYFLQMVFPLFHTRFIAVTDGFDSIEHQDGSDGFEVAIKLMLSENYSRDLSKKIKSAKRSRALRGESVNKNCAFGFKKVGNTLEIDEPAAEVVRMIFDMKKDGISYTGIATHLYENKYPTPSEYRRKVKEPSCIWEKSVLYTILIDEQYIGTYVAGKTRKIDVGGKKTVAVDESEWIKIPGHHPAIVDKATFMAAHENMSRHSEPARRKKKSTSERYRGIASPLKGKVVCGCCNHTMRLSSTRNKMFGCHHTYAAPDAPCYHFKISAAGLSETVLDRIKQKAAVISNETENADMPLLSDERYWELVEKYKKEKRSLYERFVSGEISAEEFTASKNAIDAEVARLNLKSCVMQKELAQQQSKRQLQELLKPVAKEKELTQELAESLIDKVIVYPGGNIEIKWKLPDINDLGN